MHILIIGCDTETNRKIDNYFAVEGHSVKSIPDGSEALRHLIHHSYDTLIIDTEVEGMDGITFLERLKQQANNTPKITISHDSDFESKRKYLSSRVDDYLTKPVHLEELLLRIKTIRRRCRV